VPVSCGSAGAVRAGLPRPTVCSRLTVLAALTDLEDDAVALECLHRARANAEHRVRCAKHTGLENLPFRGFVHTAVWLEISLIAQDLSPGRSTSRSTATSPSANPRRCLTGCYTPPVAWDSRRIKKIHLRRKIDLSSDGKGGAVLDRPKD